MKTVTVKAQVILPCPPDCLRMTDGQLLPIEAVEEDGLREIGAAWTEALIEHARLRAEQVYAP
jgi:hypothetical protein